MSIKLICIFSIYEKFSYNVPLMAIKGINLSKPQHWGGFENLYHTYFYYSANPTINFVIKMALG